MKDSFFYNCHSVFVDATTCFASSLRLDSTILELSLILGSIFLWLEFNYVLSDSLLSTKSIFSRRCFSYSFEEFKNYCKNYIEYTISTQTTHTIIIHTTPSPIKKKKKKLSKYLSKDIQNVTHASYTTHQVRQQWWAFIDKHNLILNLQ